MWRNDFPNLEMETNIQVQEAQRVPNIMYPKKSTPRHIIIKCQNLKTKRKILKAEREKQSCIQGNPHTITSWYFSRIFAGQKARYIQSDKNKNLQPRILYQARFHSELKDREWVSQTSKLKEYITTKWALQEILKELFWTVKQKAKLDVRKYMKGKNHWQRQKCSKGSGSTIYKANMEVKDKSSKIIYINNN